MVLGVTLLSACSTASQKVAAPGSSTTPSAPASVSPMPSVGASASPAPGQQDWSKVFADASTGVVRIDVRACGSGGTGTGFLIGPTLVATVAHVVEGAQRVRITAPKLALVTTGQVIGIDHDHDLALVRTDVPLTGHIFDLRPEQPPIGTEIGVIGFPLGRSMQLTIGHITDTHDRRRVGGEGFNVELSDVLLTDAAQNPGNSGGPWLTRDGEVVALAESGPPAISPGGQASAPALPAQGNNGGVPASDAKARLSAWRVNLRAVTGCGSGVQTDAEAAQETLLYYLWFINQSDYEAAYAQLEPRLHSRAAEAAFVEGVKSSQDSALDGDPQTGPLYDLVNVQGVGDRVMADVKFRSRQDSLHGPDGLTCTDWHLQYEFVRAAGLWLIAKSSAVGSDPKYVPCPGESGTPAPGTNESASATPEPSPTSGITATPEPSPTS